MFRFEAQRRFVLFARRRVFIVAHQRIRQIDSAHRIVRVLRNGFGESGARRSLIPRLAQQRAKIVQRAPMRRLLCQHR